mmetsp:Transcript_28389/g.23826  ORF Transcript_28389/g.23826 Transcript_28389/m.23826 type:complete len:108 (-) Transcript_28389:999-1322(-)
MPVSNKEISHRLFSQNKSDKFIIESNHERKVENLKQIINTLEAIGEYFHNTAKQSNDDTRGSTLDYSSIQNEHTFNNSLNNHPFNHHFSNTQPTNKPNSVNGSTNFN